MTFSTDAQSPDDPPADKVVICHWTNGGHWNQIEVSESALNAHTDHRFDIWPPIEGVTEGENWELGQKAYDNGCETTTRPSMSATPEPTMSTSPTNSAPPVTDVPSLVPTVTATVTVSPTPPPVPTPEPCTTVSGANVALLSVALLVAASLIRWRQR